MSSLSDPSIAKIDPVVIVTWWPDGSLDLELDDTSLFDDERITVALTELRNRCNVNLKPLIGRAFPSYELPERIVAEVQAARAWVNMPSGIWFHLRFRYQERVNVFREVTGP